MNIKKLNGSRQYSDPDNFYSDELNREKFEGNIISDSVDHDDSGIISSEDDDIPNSQEQARVVKRMREKYSVREGDRCYLIPVSWYNHWTAYSSSLDNFPNTLKAPKSINTRNLYVIGNSESADQVDPLGLPLLRPGLVHEIDFICVEEHVWSLFIRWYGIVDGAIPVRREITSGMEVDWNLPAIKYTVEEDIHNPTLFVNQPPYNYDNNHASLLIDITNESENYSNSGSIFLPSTHHKLPDDGLQLENDKKILFTCLPRSCTIGQFLLYFRQKKEIPEAKIILSDGKFISSVDFDALVSTHAGIFRFLIPSKKCPPALYDASFSGLVGLRNLGNTCFMNSALQCLSNCRPLTSYIVSGKHFNEINRTNPIGTGGVLAERYHHLMYQIWDSSNNNTEKNLQGEDEISESNLQVLSNSNNNGFSDVNMRLRVIDPRRFKEALDRFEPRFAGYQQHDAQEVASCILDRLHEDLNRVIKKPYVELKDSDGRPDKLVADEAWSAHRSRNNSIVVDSFHGQFRSQVVCSVCSHVSVTFDPFSFLSLPIPVPPFVMRNILLVEGLSSRLIQIEVPRRGGTVADILNGIASILDAGESLDNSGYFKKFEINAKVETKNYANIFDTDNLNSASQVNFELKKPPSVIANSDKNESLLESNRHDDIDPMAKGKKPRTVDTLVAVELYKNNIYRELSPGTPIDRVSIISDPQSFAVYRHPFCDQPCVWISFLVPRSVLSAASSASDLSLYNSDSFDDEEPARFEQEKRSKRLNANYYLADAGEYESSNGENKCDHKSDDPVDDTNDGELCSFGRPVFLVALGIEDLQKWASKMFGLSCTLERNRESTYRHSRISYVLTIRKRSENLALLDTYDSSSIAGKDDLEDGSQRNNLQITLDDCIKLFSQEEQLAGDELWYCPRCQSHRPATKRMTLYRVPPVLIIHFKRFKFTSRYSGEKIGEQVQFPIVNLNLDVWVSPVENAQEDLTGRSRGESLRYDLYGVSEHYGCLGGGHYTATCRNWVNGSWYHFDDSRVTPFNPKLLAGADCRAAAYMLFYQQRGPKSSHTVN